MTGYLLGYDAGSSFIKAALLDAGTGRVAAQATSPASELAIAAPRAGWAEQDPSDWWENLVRATRMLGETPGVDLKQVRAVGISYQMHGLVLIDRNQRVLRPAIIWCDGRAASIGARAFRELGEERCLERLLNSPGNFTASRLRWVRENEPGIYTRIDKAMLPGDWIARELTGEARTTAGGLSEAILWDCRDAEPARFLLDYYDISPDLLPPLVPTFSRQGEVTRQAAERLGLAPGTPVTYRAGDQPNNAFSLGVLDPGRAAATAGTSGVVYGVVDRPVWDRRSRVNAFLHVNHMEERPRYGVLMCVNGAGSANRWLRQLFTSSNNVMNYRELDEAAADVPPGCAGLTFLPFGNGPERTLEDRDPGAGLRGLRFNLHGRAHLARAVQEGVAFALACGVGIMREMGLAVSEVRAGTANMFKSPVFTQAFAAAAGCAVELYETDGAQGAARGAGLGVGIYKDMEEAFAGLAAARVVESDPRRAEAYGEAFARWKEALAGESSRP
jgi:xylulokinase